MAETEVGTVGNGRGGASLRTVALAASAGETKDSRQSLDGEAIYCAGTIAMRAKAVESVAER